MEKAFMLFIGSSWLLSILSGNFLNGETEISIMISGGLITQSDSIPQNKCMECHAALFEKKIKHQMTEVSGCNDCHKSNGNEHPKTGVTGFALADKLPGLCLACHEETKNNIAGYAYVHKALDDKKSCTYCHSPHSSAEKKLLSDKSKELCFGCHNKTIPVTVNGYARTLSNMEQLSKNSTVFHPPFKKCGTSCHNPHGSDHRFLLTRSYPANDYAPANKDSFSLCFECHDPELMEAQTTTTATSFRNGDKNLHYKHIHGEKGRKCTFCHSPHATENPYIIRDVARFGNFEFKLNFIADSTGGSCFPGCHGVKKYNRVMAIPDSIQGK